MPLRKAVLSRVKWRPGPEDRKPEAEKPCGNHVQFAQPNALKPHETGLLITLALSGHTR
jgi:hypothetical protein